LRFNADRDHERDHPQKGNDDAPGGGGVEHVESV
jgi:hypothetical protein